MVTDRDFIDAAAKGLALEAEPFAPLAARLGLSVAEVIVRLERLIAEGKVRRFAASVRHQPIGYRSNAMIIARCRPELLDAIGSAAAGLPGVSHCYHRDHPDGDPNCVYVMVHGHGHETIDQTAQAIAALPGVLALELCPSRGELKKTSLAGVSSDLD